MKDDIKTVIEEFESDIFDKKGGGGKTLVGGKERDGNFRIDLQGQITVKEPNKPDRYYANLQIQQNVPRKPGKPTSIATVLVETGVQFPEGYIQTAFIDSMIEHKIIKLSKEIEQDGGKKKGK